MLVTYNHKPVSAPIICKPGEPEAIIKTGIVLDIEPIYVGKTIKRPVKQDSLKEVKKTIKTQPKPEKIVKEPLHSQSQKTEKIANTVSKPLKKRKKPEKTEEEVKKDPKVEEEKLKKLQKIVQTGLAKHKQIKEAEKLKKEAFDLQLKEKQKMIEETKNKAKEAILDTKMKPYQPTGRWGADERNFKEMTEKEREKVKKERALQELAKKEYREKVKQEGRARIGLEIVDLYPEILEKKRAKSISNQNEEKKPKSEKPKNKEIIE